MGKLANLRKSVTQSPVNLREKEMSKSRRLNESIKCKAKRKGKENLVEVFTSKKILNEILQKELNTTHFLKSNVYSLGNF